MFAMPLTLFVARSRHALMAAVMLWVVAVVGSCDRRMPDPAGEHGPGKARIVSLSPAITECAVELGLGDLVVGRTPWCEGVARDVPVVGTLLDVDAEALVRSSPTMVLVQPPAQGVDPALATLAARHGWTVHAWRINGLDDARAAMAGLADAVADADPALASGVQERHDAWRAMIDEALVPLPAASSARDSAVLVISGGLEGIAFGRGTYVDDALARIGVRNALDRPGYPALSVEDVVRIAPGTIVVIGGSGDRAASHPAAEAVPSRVIRVPADGLSVPGGRLPHGLKALRDALSSVEGQDGG
jgi:ABC-type hemin transport system substrate-binding protein